MTDDIFGTALEGHSTNDGIVDVELEQKKLVIVSISGALFALPGEDSKEILIPSTIFPIPGTPAFVAGVITVRGEIEAVIRLDDLLGVAATGTGKQARIVVVEKAGLRAGLIVDEVRDVSDFTVDLIVAPPVEASVGSGGIFSGVLAVSSGNIPIIDFSAVFAKLLPPNVGAALPVT